jgi:GNAT superfamily N-acetyltransferase
MQIVQPSTPEQLDAFRLLLREWFDFLVNDCGIDMGYQSIEAELAGLPGAFGLPQGRIWLAYDDAGEPVGCVAVRPMPGEGVCELKRLYVRPVHRGAGLGRALAVRAIDEARAMGYGLMRLDTGTFLEASRRLYASLGFVETGPYYDVPPDVLRVTVFMELRLHSRAPQVPARGRQPDRPVTDAPAPEVRLERIDEPADSEPLRALLSEYLQWVADLARERFGLSWDVDAMVDSDLHDASKFTPPGGRCYLVGDGDGYVGVGCLMRLAPGIAEIQRMYVRPRARGAGAGRRLVAQLIDDARELGYRKVRLESLKALAPAHGLYRSVGFVEIPPDAVSDMESFQPAGDMGRYRESVLFMELVL